HYDTNLKGIGAYVAWDTMRNRDVETVEEKKESKPTPNEKNYLSERKPHGQQVIDALFFDSEDEVMRKFNLSKGQFNAIKAHKTMGRYEPPLQVINYQGAVFEGREGNVFGTVQLLERRYGGIDNIPQEQFERNKIKVKY
ncbi:hypothetical protein HYV87_02365, partial [Candidatus Woesearchaeota archaeon]|nr:hypothetical protein [Candidatus Woesearchaeota archaeon]